MYRFSIIKSKEAAQLVLAKFDKFAETVRSAVGRNQIIENPYYFVLKGNNLMFNKKYTEAVAAYQKAIDMCGTGAGASYSMYARYNKACALIHASPSKSAVQKEALDELREAKKLIKRQFHADLISFHTMVSMGEQAANSRLSVQVQNEMNILGQLENSIEAAIDVLETAIREDCSVKVDLNTLDETFKGTEPDHSDELRQVESNGFQHLFQVIMKVNKFMKTENNNNNF